MPTSSFDRLRTETNQVAGGSYQKAKALSGGPIPQAQVKEAEQAFVAALDQVHEMRHSVLETDIAITEAVLGKRWSACLRWR